MTEMLGVAGIQARMAELRALVAPQSTTTATTATTTATATATDFASTLQSVIESSGSATASTTTTASSYDPAAWPAVSADGTYRVPKSGSGRLDRSTLSQISWAPKGTVLRSDAAQAFEKLNAAFSARFGENLKVSGAGAYRDYDTQASLKASKGRLAATPGTSNHGWGLAVDISNLGGEGSAKHAWLRANAPAYGWDHPSWARPGGSKPEAWHWEYVG